MPYERVWSVTAVDPTKRVKCTCGKHATVRLEGKSDHKRVRAHMLYRCLLCARKIQRRYDLDVDAVDNDDTK
jgi:hypothetical protein